MKMLFLPKTARKTSIEERRLIEDIGDRAAKDLQVDNISTEMDLLAVHTCDCKLDLEKLLSADTATFGHDIRGIARFLDRRTFKLTGHFCPRCAA